MQQLRPTFSESWYRVADLKVRLRASAQISRQHYRGDRWYVVRDPAGNQFHRLSASAYKFVGLLDGKRTVAEAWDLVGGQLADDSPTQNEVIQILSQLHAANLVEADITPDAAVLLKRHKRLVKQQWQGRLMNVLFPRIPLWDPDRFLCRWLPVVRPFIGAVGAMIWLAVVGLAVFALLPHWPQLKAHFGGGGGGQSNVMDPANWPYLWGTFVLIKLIHELGHAFTCRRFGGEVHELGIMFLVFIPTPYVDASTAWAFQNKWARILVGAGGMIIELFVAAIMAFVWINTNENSLINQLAFNTMFIASVSTVIFNANPLLRYDGYYILSDWLEIPNLRYKATEYALGLIKRHIFGVKQTQPLPPLRQRFWLFSYAITSGIYRILVGITIILVVSNQVPVLGVLMAIGGVVTWLVMPIGKIAHYHLLNPELHRNRLRAAGFTVSMAAAIVLVIGLIKFPVHLDIEGLIQPARREVVRAGQAGVMVKLIARDGEKLKAGDPIATLSNPELDAQLAIFDAQLEGMLAQLGKAQVSDGNMYNSLLAQIPTQRQRIALLKQQQDKLVIRAPIDGELVAYDLRNKVGQFISAGDELGRVEDRSLLKFVGSIDKTDEALIYYESHKSARVRLVGDAGRERAALMDTVHTPTPQYDLPASSLGFNGGGSFATDPKEPSGRRLMAPQIEVSLVLENADPTLLSNQRAFARLDMNKKPLIWQWGRRFWQLVEQHQQQSGGGMAGIGNMR